MEKLFKLKERKTKVSIKIMAGITTFLAMSYILIVNPNTILSGTSDPRFSSVFIATAIGSFIASLLMSLIANSPLVEAPGMGFNAMIGGIIAGSLGFAYSYGNAMLLVFISGLLFLLISVLPSSKKENGRVDSNNHKKQSNTRTIEKAEVHTEELESDEFTKEDMFLAMIKDVED